MKIITHWKKRGQKRLLIKHDLTRQKLGSGTITFFLKAIPQHFHNVFFIFNNENEIFYFETKQDAGIQDDLLCPSRFI
jgi:hypothetical protein